MPSPSKAQPLAWANEDEPSVVRVFSADAAVPSKIRGRKRKDRTFLPHPHPHLPRRLAITSNRKTNQSPRIRAPRRMALRRCPPMPQQGQLPANAWPGPLARRSRYPSTPRARPSMRRRRRSPLSTRRPSFPRKTKRQLVQLWVLWAPYQIGQHCERNASWRANESLAGCGSGRSDDLSCRYASRKGDGAWCGWRCSGFRGVGVELVAQGWCTLWPWSRRCEGRWAFVLKVRSCMLMCCRSFGPAFAIFL